MNRKFNREEAELLLSLSPKERRKYLFQKKGVTVKDIIELYCAKVLYEYKEDVEAVREANELLKFAKARFLEQYLNLF